MSKIHPSEITSFHQYFCGASDLETLKRRVSNISDVNLPIDGNKNYLLHKAAIRGEVRVAKCLIENGANMYVQNEWGRLPMHTAILSNKLNIVELLIEHGQDVNSHLGGLPLCQAVLWERIEIVKILLEKGAKIDLKNANGFTPLEYAKLKASSISGYKIYEIMKKAAETKRQKPKVKTTVFDDCVVCDEERSSELFALVPCLHANLCQKCCKKILNENNPKCPTCRVQIIRFQKVFY